MMKLSISFLSLNLFPQLTNSETIRVEMGGGGGLGDILGAMMGGGGMMMGGGGSNPPKVEFPSGISDRIDDSFNWLVNTEWKGKSGNVVFNRDGELGGTLKACLDRRGQLKEGVCKWSANKNMVYIITPDTQKTTDKVLKFNVKGTNAYFYGPKSSEDAPTKDEKKEAKAKLDAHEEAVLKSITLESTKVAARTGKASILEFVKVVSSSEEDSLLAEDAFAVLDLLGTDENPRSPEEVTAAEIKKAYRKLSVKNHPDKGGDPVFFDKIRMSYEMLSDDDKRRYYLEGGALLVKNVETHYKEMEGMVAQQMAQLDQQIPKSHPMRAQAEAQIKAQEKSKSQLKTEIEQRLKQEEQVVEVPVSMEELFEGVESKEFHYERSVICRGCRSDSTLRNEAMCNSCGRCPPETREVPKMQGPFMVGSKTVEVESREKCRKVVQKIAGLRIPANAEDGSRISVRGNMRGKIFSHQTPGRFPGPVKLVVKRLEDKTYRSLKDDLYTVLSITPEEALFGFKKQWKLYSDASGPIVIDRIGKTTRPDEVIRVANRGMHSSSGGRGHLYVRINVGVKDYPSKALTIEEMTERKKKLDLENEEEGGAMVNTSTDLSAELEVKEENGDHWKVWDRDNEYYHKTMKRLNKMKNSEGGEKKKKSKSKEEL